MIGQRTFKKNRAHLYSVCSSKKNKSDHIGFFSRFFLRKPGFYYGTDYRQKVLMYFTFYSFK